MMKCCAFSRDPNSFANIDEIHQKHIHFDWVVDFNTRTISGTATIDAVAQGDNVDTFICDNRDLAIHSVVDAVLNKPLEYSHQSINDEFGSALVIKLAKPLNKSETCKIAINYTTARKATGIQWLPPEQTAGGVHPFLFTQNQAIHARSCAPLQDAPGVKLTYSATVTVPAPLVALMSAVSTGKTNNPDNTITYTFEQKICMPSYLICLAIGALVKRDIGPRSAVWSEPEMVDKGATEFVETEQYLSAGEEICGPYVWGRYDLLLLPPSFPYGGMENPQLTFVTPTLLAGDRSLANVVAHEIAHSWTGNLVTNRTWEHFWLNEGFTVFVERKIIGKIYGKETADFHAIEGYQSLEATIEHFGAKNPLTSLVVKLDNIDPDDSFSTVPYEKGFNFLYYLESLVGEQVFGEWLKKYLLDYSFVTVTTEMWKAHLLAFLESKGKAHVLDQVDWDAWLHAPGMPPVKNTFDESQAREAQHLADRWIRADGEKVEEFNANDLKGFNSLQIVVFLNILCTASPPLSLAKVQKLDSLYQCSQSGNCEILCSFFSLALKAGYEQIYPLVADFVTKQGRMKYVRPLYRALAKAGTSGNHLAVETFQRRRSFYHNICSSLLEKDLNLKSQ